ncbi:D-arabinono-1,4-lactone oxidase [Tessaracoccus massiliensis]|uniref:D-arabinono-1,4-lactone oxidase n=1 Tax=Tessaracoccus massiliensis TaxID=1522311 RepID=UPI00058B9536|nr:D-arabinono-1,4-lactone oxidase [Tessaracoccus massiliensis]
MTWRNWSGAVRCNPAEIAKPGTEAEVAEILVRAAAEGRTVRPVGAGHSFTPLVATDDVLVSLDGLSGVVAANPFTGDVTLWGGTRIRDIAQLLAPWGLALPNMGDIDAQSIAGAVSTGTHGTGLGYTGYSGIVTGLKLALPDGSLVEAHSLVEPASSTSSVETPRRSDGKQGGSRGFDAAAPLASSGAAGSTSVFEAARVGLGVMGIITRVTLRCVPAFALECTETTEPVDALLESYLERSRRADHLEFFWFPGTRRATVKELRRLPPLSPTRPMSRLDRLVKRELLGNVAFGAMDAAAAKVPALARPVRQVASRFMAGATFSDASHRVYVAPRRVRFRETEYAMPVEAFGEVVREVERAIVASGEQITFPMEVRTAAADDTWLGTASGRESVYVAVHRYHRERFEPLLTAVEPVFRAHEGRPHWGKEHSLTADRLAGLYPRFDDFRAARAAVDPDGVLLNPHTRALLGIEG